MRKNLFLPGMLLALTLASCSSPGQFKEINDDFIIGNINQENEVASYHFGERYSFPSYLTILDKNYIDLGIVVVRDQYNEIGIYSLPNRQFLLQPNSWFNGTITTQLGGYYDNSCVYLLRQSSYNDVYDNVFLLFLPYEGLSTYRLVDNLGNILLTDVDRNEIGGYHFDMLQNKKDVYRLINYNNEIIYFTYKDKELTFITDFYEPEQTEENDILLNTGDHINKYDLLDLESYGAPGYQLLKKHGFTYIFNNYKYLTSYPNMPEGIRVGTKGYFQTFASVHILDDKYDFIYDGGKYIYSTYQYDILTGKKEEIKDFNYLFRVSSNKYPDPDINYPDYNSSINNEYYYPSSQYIKLKDRNGDYKYGFGRFLKINKNKTANEYFNYIYDKNLTFVKDVPFSEFPEFRKFGRNYIDVRNRTIYTGNLVPLFTFRNYGPFMINEKYGVASIQNEYNYYALVNSDGKLLTDFEYDNVYTSNGELFVLRKDDVTYLARYIAQNDSIQIYDTLPGASVRQVANGLFAIGEEYLVTNNGDKVNLPYERNVIRIVAIKNNKPIIIIEDDNGLNPYLQIISLSNEDYPFNEHN